MNLNYLLDDSDTQNVNNYKSEVIGAFKNNNNFCMFIQRGNYFESNGRIHNLEQSKKLDTEIKKTLKDNEIFYGTYNHAGIKLSIKNCIKTYSRVNGLTSQHYEKVNQKEDNTFMSESVESQNAEEPQEEQTSFGLTPNL